MLLASCALPLCGCVAQKGQIEQSLARIDRIEASLARVDQLEARVGTIETKIEQSQGQHGIINIASMESGVGIIGYIVAIAIAIVAWKLWRARSYWKKSSQVQAEEIERDAGLTRGVRTRIAKRHANDTPHGKLVRCLTSKSKTCSSTASG